jgi:methylmalonyl-CoA mutase N-terminal domain/subunit
MRERFGAKNPRSWMLRFHTQTGGSTLTAQQPEVNVVRVTIQALAAVLGGTQSLHTNGMDEALQLPTEHAARLALRTQQVIAHESGVADTVDPLAGSYAIEALTDEIEKQARAYIARIDDLGGALNAIERGYIQNEVQEAAYRYQQSVESKAQVVVGVNEFASREAVNIERLKIDPAIEQTQCEKVRALRARRDPGRVSELRTRLETAARSSENLIPLFVTCVESDLTLGEICGTLRGVWGEYRPGT